MKVLVNYIEAFGYLHFLVHLEMHKSLLQLRFLRLNQNPCFRKIWLQRLLILKYYWKNYNTEHVVANIT